MALPEKLKSLPVLDGGGLSTRLAAEGRSLRSWDWGRLCRSLESEGGGGAASAASSSSRAPEVTVEEGAPKERRLVIGLSLAALLWMNRGWGGGWWRSAGAAALLAVVPVAPLDVEVEEDVVGPVLDDPEGLLGRRGDFDLPGRDLDLLRGGRGWFCLAFSAADSATASSSSLEGQCPAWTESAQYCPRAVR